MLSDEQRQQRREQLMKKHRKMRGGFVYNNSGRLRTLHDLYRIDPVLDLFLFKRRERKSK
jgi:hypothetical protein